MSPESIVGLVGVARISVLVGGSVDAGTGAKVLLSCEERRMVQVARRRSMSRADLPLRGRRG
jgi:hypothetical protein